MNLQRPNSRWSQPVRVSQDDTDQEGAYAVFQGFYPSFCRIDSPVIEPLAVLLKKEAQFVWSDLCRLAFENVKALWRWCVPPRVDEAFCLQVDVSNVGAGAVLLQAGEQGIDDNKFEYLETDAL